MANNERNIRIAIEIEGKEAVNEFERISQKVDTLKGKTNELKDANKEYSNTMKVLKAELALLTKGTEEYANKKADIDKLKLSMKQNGEAIKQLRLEQAQANQELEDTRRQLGLNDMTFKQLKQTVSALAREVEDLIPGTEKFIQKSEELKKVNERYRQVRQEIQGYQKEITKTNQQFALSIDLVSLADGAIDKTKELAGSVDETARAMGVLRREIALLTGATGENLDKLSVQVQTIATTFDQDFNEVIRSGNTLSKEFGVNFQESFKTIETSLLNVSAVQRGEILEQMKEYSVQAKAAGLTIDQFAGVLVNASNLGVFSDKGIDVVKEFGLRIREQTTATRDALANAFGVNFTDKLFKDINSGAVNTTKALEIISKKLGDTSVSASKTQTVIADVFGGPGEDAGLNYIISLQNISGGLQAVAKDSKNLTKEQQLALEQNKKLAEEQNSLAKEYKDFAQGVDAATKQVQIFTIQGITNTIRTIKDFIMLLYENRTALLAMTVAVIAYNAQLIYSKAVTLAWGAVTVAINIARNAWTLLNVVMRANPILLVISLLAALATAIFSTKEGYAAMTSALQSFGNAWKTIYNSVVSFIKPFEANLTSFGQAISNLFYTVFVVIKDLFVYLLKVAKPVLEGFGVAIARIITFLQPLARVAAAVLSIFTTAFGDVLKIVGDIFRLDFKAAFTGFFTYLTNIAQNTLNVFKSVGREIYRLYDAQAVAAAEAEEKRKRDLENFAKETPERIRQTQERIEKMKQQREAEAKRIKQETNERKQEEKKRLDELTQEQLQKQKEMAEKLAEAQKKYDDTNLQNKRKLEDLRLELIDDSLERERKKIALEASRRIEDIKKQKAELKKQEATIGLKIDENAIPTLTKQIEAIRAEAQRKIAQVELKQTIRTIEIQESQAKRTLVETTAGATDEQKLQARRDFNQKMFALQVERIDTELKTLDAANAEDLAKINVLNTQKLELVNKQKEDELALNLTAIEEKYALLQEAEEIKFLEKNASEEELRKQILAENFDSLMQSEIERNRALYDLQKAALEEQLTLLQNAGKGKTAEAIKLQKALLQNEIDYQTTSLNNEKRTAEMKRKVQDGYFKASSNFVALGIELLGADEEARKQNAGKIKAFTVAKILTDLASEIAGYFATPASTATLGVIGAINQGIAIARAGISIRNVLSQEFADGGLLKNGKKITPFATAKSYGTGGMVRNAGVLQGSSHAQGGLSVFDNRTGQQVAEFEGGEPAMILSANTYQNNKGLIDNLLYSSLYRNGAPVRTLAQGGIVNTNSSSANFGANPAPITLDLSELVTEIRDLKTQVANQQNLLRAYIVYSDITKADEEITNLVQKNSF